MPDVIEDLYENRIYPAMSHPLSDPAVSAVAARLAGLETALPSEARVLEIGCCSGHNLLPLALRWPRSRFIGIDLSAKSIATAKAHAAAAGISNVEFQAVDLRQFEPDGPFDFIIAHGFFSWVPDEVKQALLSFCHRHLAPAGIATISFNLESGWKPRLPVIHKARAIQAATGASEMEALAVLADLTESNIPEAAIIADMIAKGPAILAFDDFGPVNDPWPLDRFARAAGAAGLRWLGESDASQNLPKNLTAEALARLQQSAGDALQFQMAADEGAGRTFRSGLLCRTDAPVAERISTRVVMDFSIRAGADEAVDQELLRSVKSFAPSCVPVREIIATLPTRDPADLAWHIVDGITNGSLLARIEAVAIDSNPPEYPKLDPFRRVCANEELPLVDAWHVPCAFPPGHYQILQAMNGANSVAELAALSRQLCPELDFDPWLRHLAGRGIFCAGQVIS